MVVKNHYIRICKDLELTTFGPQKKGKNPTIMGKFRKITSDNLTPSFDSCQYVVSGNVLQFCFLKFTLDLHKICPMCFPSLTSLRHFLLKKNRACFKVTTTLYKSQSYFKPQLFARMERYFSLNIHQNNCFLLIREIFDNQTVQTTNFFQNQTLHGKIKTSIVNPQSA